MTDKERQRKTEANRKWRAKNREHYRTYQREYKRRMRASQDNRDSMEYEDLK